MGLACFKSWKYDSAARKGGNRDVPVSPGSYFFLSNSCGQGEEWLKTLNKGVWIPFTGVFGQRLEETVVYERRYGEHMAPLVVEQCVAFIRERGLLEVGLFRQPGQATLVKELQEAFDAGEKPSFDSSTDVHTVASLLKLYLRELPEPVVPFSRYQHFLLCGKHTLTDRKQGLVELKKLLHELPVANFNLLHYICQFLNEVQSYSSSNRMSIQNLATVFGPNILRPKAEDPESIIGGAAVVQQLMSELIRECDSLFGRDTDAVTWPDPALPSAQHGDAEEEGAHTGALHPAEQHTPAACTRQLSLSLAVDRKGELQSSQSETAPRRRSEAEHRHPETPSLSSFSNTLHDGHQQSRPERHSAETGGALPPPPPTLGQDGPVPDSALPGGWARRERRSWAAERRRGSDANDSTLSVYDNIDSRGRAPSPVSPGSPAAVAPDDGMTSADESSWSSCEVLLQEGGARNDTGAGTGPGTGAGRASSLRTDPEELRVNSPASSTALTDAPLSSGSSEVFLPSAPPDPSLPASSNTMQCLLAGLRQQMARQKAEYEAQIRSLERQNEALQGEVAGLQANLEQQRRWYNVVEMKMRNAERARADADRRNTALQQEMEQFFDTFGELSSEARKAERIVQSF
ncbi:rho GTPase-activating protein 24 [Megalops cyprinoides]|uniref:rho GTPase-activating protein 24 n=1 Tax=Megalops cyprinoides TaxID=118141 RepID=UPI001864B1C8|nr:rho GTPase-activating protein 24 [Megalops cyprinoides]